jgi:hypothetical protein
MTRGSAYALTDKAATEISSSGMVRSETGKTGILRDICNIPS